MAGCVCHYFFIIYLTALKASPQQCSFIDDFSPNLVGSFTSVCPYRPPLSGLNNGDRAVIMQYYCIVAIFVALISQSSMPLHAEREFE